jgi:hypothetical protein
MTGAAAGQRAHAPSMAAFLRTFILAGFTQVGPGQNYYQKNRRLINMQTAETLVIGLSIYRYEVLIIT